jgi:hypothetical protein
LISVKIIDSIDEKVMKHKPNIIAPMHEEFKEDIPKQKFANFLFKVIGEDMKVIINNLQHFGNWLRVFFVKYSSHP